jgi:hypothetical protein
MALSITEFIRRTEALAKVIGGEEISRRVSIVALTRLEGLHKERIFREGKATDGGKIGNYSTKPYYANSRPKLLPKSKLKPLGKNGKSKFKNGKQKKTRYLPGGYKEYRDRVGPQSSKVDLSLTQTSEESLAVGQKGNKYTYGYTNKKASTIIKANEKRFKKEVEKPTQREIKEMSEAALKEWVAVLTEAYNE